MEDWEKSDLATIMDTHVFLSSWLAEAMLKLEYSQCWHYGIIQATDRSMLITDVVKPMNIWMAAGHYTVECFYLVTLDISRSLCGHSGDIDLGQHWLR